MTNRSGANVTAAPFAYQREPLNSIHTPAVPRGAGIVSSVVCRTLVRRLVAAVPTAPVGDVTIVPPVPAAHGHVVCVPLVPTGRAASGITRAASGMTCASTPVGDGVKGVAATNDGARLP